MKNLALFDIDKTIYNGYTIFPLTEFQKQHNLISKSCLNSLYLDLDKYKNNKINYETFIANLLIHWAEGLKNIKYKDILKNTSNFFNQDNNIYSYFPKFISKYSKTYDIYLITGEPSFIPKIISEKYKLDGYKSSEFEIVDEKFSGKVKNFLATKNQKQEAMKKYLSNYSDKNSIAFGDSDGDIEILNQVEFPVCINPSGELKNHAQKNNWTISTPEKVDFLLTKLLNKILI